MDPDPLRFVLKTVLSFENPPNGCSRILISGIVYLRPQTFFQIPITGKMSVWFLLFWYLTAGVVFHLHGEPKNLQIRIRIHNTEENPSNGRSRTFISGLVNLRIQGCGLLQTFFKSLLQGRCLFCFCYFDYLTAGVVFHLHCEPGHAQLCLRSQVVLPGT